MFKVGVPVFNDDFIDRKEELKNLRFYLTECGNQSVMIHAPRRFGKTSLIKECFRIIEPKNKYLLYFDFKHYSSLEHLSHSIVEKMYMLLGVTTFWENFKSGAITFLKHLKPKLNVKIYKNIELTLEPIEMMLKENDEVEVFVKSINFLEELAGRLNISLKVAFDEFQDLYNLTKDNKVLDKLRSVVQHQNHVAYIFCGSHETLMNKIFFDKRSAFFQFSRIIQLGSLDQKELTQYIINKFNLIKVELAKDLLINVLSQLECHPYYTMKTMQILHGVVVGAAIKLITNDILQESLDSAYYETKSYLEDVVNYVRIKAHHLDMLISIVNNTPPKLDALNSYRVRQSLINMGLVKSTGRGQYVVLDVFLKRYLLELN